MIASKETIGGYVRDVKGGHVGRIEAIALLPDQVYVRWHRGYASWEPANKLVLLGRAEVPAADLARFEGARYLKAT